MPCSFQANLSLQGLCLLNAEPMVEWQRDDLLVEASQVPLYFFGSRLNSSLNASSRTNGSNLAEGSLHKIGPVNPAASK